MKYLITAILTASLVLIADRTIIIHARWEKWILPCIQKTTYIKTPEGYSINTGVFVRNPHTGQAIQCEDYVMPAR